MVGQTLGEAKPGSGLHPAAVLGAGVRLQALALCAGGNARPRMLAEELRTLPMPEHVYLVEVIRRHDLSRLFLDESAFDGDPPQPPTLIHGEILLDPTWSEMHVLAAWFENLLLTPRSTAEQLHEPMDLVERYESMKQEVLDFEKGQRYVLSWFHNKEHWSDV